MKNDSVAGAMMRVLSVAGGNRNEERLVGWVCSDRLTLGVCREPARKEPHL